MNILFLSFNQEGRGTFLRAFSIAKELVKKGYQLTLCCTSGRNQFEDKQIDGVRVVAFQYGHRFLSGWNLTDVRARIGWLKGQHFDIVHAFEMRPTCSVPALKMQNKNTYLFTDWADWFGRGGSVEERTSLYQRTLLRPFETFFEEQFRKKANGTTVICSELMNLSLSIGLPLASLQHLPNGFNQSSKTPLNIPEARASLDLPLKTFVIGFLGTFFPRDLDLLWKSIELIRAKRDDVQFLHIGQSPQMPQLKSVNSTGFVDREKLKLYLQACDILLLPMYDSKANRGRFPLKFSDYLSSGRPILTTDVGDVPKIVSQYEVGIVAHPLPNELANSALILLEDQDGRKKYGENAWTLSQNFDFSWEKRAEQLVSFYQDHNTATEHRGNQTN